MCLALLHLPLTSNRKWQVQRTDVIYCKFQAAYLDELPASQHSFASAGKKAAGQTTAATSDMNKYGIKIHYGNSAGMLGNVGEEPKVLKRRGADAASRRSGRRCRTRWCVQKPRRCRSTASRRRGCRDRWCGERSPGSGPEWDSPRCHGGQSSRRCRRTGAGSPSSPALDHLDQNL